MTSATEDNFQATAGLRCADGGITVLYTYFRRFVGSATASDPPDWPPPNRILQASNCISCVWTKVQSKHFES